MLQMYGVQRSRRKQFRLSMQCHVSTDGQRQDRDYEYIQVTWGIKIAKFLVEMELFPRKANVGLSSLMGTSKPGAVQLQSLHSTYH